MDGKDLIELTEKIKGSWEKKRGLFFSLTVIFFVFVLIRNTFPGFNLFYACLSFLFTVAVVTTYWLISTHRVLINKSDKVCIYVSIHCDEDFESKAKGLFSSITEEIKRDKDLQKLYVRLLPINSFYNNNEIEEWLNKQQGERHTIVFLKLKNGKINSDEAINLENISYTGFFKSNNLSIDGEPLNILQDIKFRIEAKDWTYLEKNCLKDKDKLRGNLKDIILYYGGLFLLNEEAFDDARIILRKLYNPNLSIVKGQINPSDNARIDFQINPEQIQAGRINYLLTRIYLKCVLIKYFNHKTDEALRLLHEVESFPATIDIKLKIKLNLAYLYYSRGDIASAKQYNSQAGQINSKSFSYLINLGFFSIIENNPVGLAQYYDAIDEDGQLDSQPLEIIAFLSDHQEKFPESKLLFEAAQALLTKLFIEEEDGNSKLKVIIERLPDTNNFKSLKKLCKKIFKKKWPKKLQRERYKSRKAA